MAKVLEVTMPDGSEYEIPVDRIVAAWIDHYGDPEGPDDSQIVDWAQNDMDWSDLADVAVMTKGPDAPDPADMWGEAEMQVEEAQPGQVGSEPVVDRYGNRLTGGITEAQPGQGGAE